MATVPRTRDQALPEETPRGLVPSTFALSMFDQGGGGEAGNSVTVRAACSAQSRGKTCHIDWVLHTDGLAGISSEIDQTADVAAPPSPAGSPSHTQPNVPAADSVEDSVEDSVGDSAEAAAEATGPGQGLTIWPSDHFAVLTTLRFGPGGRAPPDPLPPSPLI